MNQEYLKIGRTLYSFDPYYLLKGKFYCSLDAYLDSSDLPFTSKSLIESKQVKSFIKKVAENANCCETMADAKPVLTVGNKILCHPVIFIYIHFRFADTDLADLAFDCFAGL